MNKETERLMAVIDGLENKLEAAASTIEAANHTIGFLNSALAAIGVILTVGGILSYFFVIKPYTDALNKLEENMDARIEANFKTQIDKVIDSLGSDEQVESYKAAGYLSTNSALIKMDDAQLMKVIRTGRYGQDNIKNAVMQILGNQGRNQIINEFFISAISGEVKKRNGNIDEYAAETGIKLLLQNTKNEDYLATAEMIINKTPSDKGFAARVVTGYAREKKQIVDFLNSEKAMDEIINYVSNSIINKGGELSAQSSKEFFNGYQNNGNSVRLTTEEFEDTYLYKTWQEKTN